MPPTIQPTGKPAGPTRADLTVRIHLGRPNLDGELLVDGRPTSTFTGWIGLLIALDQALDALRPPGLESGSA